MIRLLVLIVLTGLCTEVLGQPSYSYGVTPYYGGYFSYRPNMKRLNLSNLYGGEIYLLKQTDGSRYWEKMYNHPKLGLALCYFDYGETDGVLGEAVSLTGFIDTELKNYRKSQLRMSLGTGMVYNTVLYNSETNHLNKAVSSKLSYVLRGNLYYTHEINELWDYNLHFSFRHYSNGRMNMPNNGMNFPVIGAGISYSPGTVKYNEPEEPEITKKFHLSLFGATAWREVWYDDYKHKAYSASLILSKRISWYSSVLIGLDGFYYSPESVYRHFTPRGVYLELEEIDGRQAGATIGHELYFGKLSLLFQAGLYIYDPHRIWDKWYQRYALKYYVTKDAFIQIGLKSHTRTANMVEWGMGLKL